MQTTIDESSLAKVVLKVLLGVLAGNDREFPRYEPFILIFHSLYVRFKFAEIDNRPALLSFVKLLFRGDGQATVRLLVCAV